MSWKHSLWRTIARVAGRASRSTGLRILGYHAVGTDIPGDRYGLSSQPNIFARQMELIRSERFGRPVNIGDAKIDGGAEISITFDDGYLDTLMTAAPILARLSLPFTVCVTPGLLDSGHPHLSWPQLTELSRMPGCEIGAHGLTHRRLDALGDMDLAHELIESRQCLEKALRRSVTVMTWPHGAASRRTQAAASAAGFTRAACSLYGINQAGRAPLLLKRVEITGFDDERDFIGKASGTWDWFSWRQADPLLRDG